MVTENVVGSGVTPSVVHTVARDAAMVASLSEGFKAASCVSIACSCTRAASAVSSAAMTWATSWNAWPRTKCR